MHDTPWFNGRPTEETLSNRSHFEKTVLLTLGQVAGLAISFLIPVFLSRWLSIEKYGTYKQLMLIHTLLLLTVHMGIDWGLFYFIKREPGRAPLFSLNAIFVDMTLAVLVCSVGLLLAPELASVLRNPELETYLAAFVPYVLFSIPSHHFTHYLVVLGRIPSAMWLTIVFEAAKALIILAAYYFYNSLMLVLLGLGTLSFLRLAALLFFDAHLCRALGVRARERSSHLRAQIKFAIPLGISNLVALVLKLDRFVVSAFFGIRHFTFYSVGCFEVPIVENTVITMADLMSFDMVEAHKEKDSQRLKRLWLSTLRKIAVFHLPITVFMVVFAREVITLIYSDVYAESAKYFALFSLIFLLPSFTPEVVFRVFAQNRLLLRLRLLAAGYTLALVIGLAWLLGPMGALYGKLAADFLSLVIQLKTLAGLLDLKFSEWLPWKEMGRVTAVAAVAAATTQFLVDNALLALPLYAVLGLGLAILCGVLKADEIQYLKQKVYRFVPI